MSQCHSFLLLLLGLLIFLNFMYAYNICHHRAREIFLLSSSFRKLSRRKKMLFMDQQINVEMLKYLINHFVGRDYSAFYFVFCLRSTPCRLILFNSQVGELPINGNVFCGPKANAERRLERHTCSLIF